jgi:hypothetical protein
MLGGITSPTVPVQATGAARRRAFFLHWGEQLDKFERYIIQRVHEQQSMFNTPMANINDLGTINSAVTKTVNVALLKRTWTFAKYYLDNLRVTNGTQLNVFISRRWTILVPLTGDALHIRVPCFHDFLNFTLQ